MDKLLQDIWTVIGGLADMYILWIIGADGTLFDFISICKIAGSIITLTFTMLRIFYAINRKSWYI